MPKKTEKETKPTKTASKSESKPEPKEEKNESPMNAMFSQQKLDIPRQYVIIGAVVIVILALAGYYISRWMVVAKVNGEVITRQEYTSELEKASGKQVLEGITTKRIIQQAAKDKNITVSDKEIDADLKKIEDQLKSQGQTLDQVLAFQGLTREGLREQIKIQKEVEKLVGDVKVSTEEIEKYIEQNDSLAGENTDLETLRATAEAQIKQQKTDQQIQSLIQELRKKAKIEYFTE